MIGPKPGLQAHSIPVLAPSFGAALCKAPDSWLAPAAVSCPTSVTFKNSECSPSTVDSDEDAPEIKVYLGSTEKKYTLVLDIDNTLVYATPHRTDKTSAATARSYLVTVRPYINLFLEHVAPLYEIVLLSAGTDKYSELIRRQLDPSGKCIVRALGRSSCVAGAPGEYVKDLRVFADRKISHMLIVDDREESYALQRHNGVPVAPFLGAEDDEELVYLTEYLEDIYGDENLVEANRAKLSLTKAR